MLRSVLAQDPHAMYALKELVAVINPHLRIGREVIPSSSSTTVQEMGAQIPQFSFLVEMHSC